LPASGWEMIAKVRRRRTAAPRGDLISGSMGSTTALAAVG
jgi:hypothetical protein